MRARKIGLFLSVTFFVGCQPPKPPPTPPSFTSVVVIDSSGAPVTGAEVFRGGELKGLTDATGQVFFAPALTSGTQLFARRLVYTHPSYRPGTNGGFVMRVYQTSRVVNNNGSVADATVTDPAVTQTLTVSPNNALIGWHLLVNLDWDASADEFQQLTKRFNDASDYLYNLTDGQFFIEQVEIADDGQLYLPAEIQFKVDSFVWAHTTYPGGFLAAVGGLPHVYMAPFANASSDHRTLIHELGHLAFGLADEYLPFTHHCTAARVYPNSTTPDELKSGGALAACFMDAETVTSKMCSAFASTVHATGNFQPGPCWTTVFGAYSDPGRTDRWVVKTPDARGAAVGTLPRLPPGLRPKITPNNKPYPGLLCEPVTVADWHGAAAANGTVWVRPKSWRNFDYTVGRLDTNGMLEVRGVHAGDTIQSPFSTLTFGCTITQ